MKGDTSTHMPDGVVTALQTQMQPADFWGCITPVVGLVATIAIFAFAYRVLNRVLRKASKGKAGV